MHGLRETILGALRAYRSPAASATGGIAMPSLCTSCGLTLPGDDGLCSHHHQVYGDDWAVGNRIFCNWIHRGVVPERLSPADRADEDFWGQATVDAA